MIRRLPIDPTGVMKMRSAVFVLLVFAFVAASPLSRSSAEEGRPGGTLYGVITDSATGRPIPGVKVTIVGEQMGAVTKANGTYEIEGVPAGTYMVRATFIGYETAEEEVTVAAGERQELNFALTPSEVHLENLVAAQKTIQLHVAPRPMDAAAPPRSWLDRLPPGFNTEGYAYVEPNAFHTPEGQPLSTFSIDVDAASYSNVRRFIRNGEHPPKGAVRIEELINYFTYDYPAPEGEHPFSITLEMGEAPWNPDHQLLHIGLQGRRIPKTERPPNNLVFLLDVSGSMRTPKKLPLLKKAFRLLANELRPQDRVAIVVYAGATGLVLPSTPGDEKETILEALSALKAGGYTAGAAGIRLAYQVAQENYLENGNNRVILATDGDFNIGVSSNAALVRLIEEKREAGVFLTVLGLGTGNLKDAKMEALADHGNGNYYYLDSELEAQKVLVDELGSTLFTIAKDVKIQVEFNPTQVAAYRLIGYENRLLDAEDFADDSTDAGELGAGHSVTALYEIIPAGTGSGTDVRPPVDLKYQRRDLTDAAHSGDVVTVRLRYKKPDGHTSRLIEMSYRRSSADSRVSNDFGFAAAVATFGMILRDSKYRGDATIAQVLALAKESKGKDHEGYRTGFIHLVEQYQRLPKTSREVSVVPR